jgi:hypothetical protein
LISRINILVTGTHFFYVHKYVKLKNGKKYEVF